MQTTCARITVWPRWNDDVSLDTLRHCYPKRYCNDHNTPNEVILLVFTSHVHCMTSHDTTTSQQQQQQSWTLWTVDRLFLRLIEFVLLYWNCCLISRCRFLERILKYNMLRLRVTHLLSKLSPKWVSTRSFCHHCLTTLSVGGDV